MGGVGVFVVFIFIYRPPAHKKKLVSGFRSRQLWPQMNQEDPGDAQVFIDSMDELRLELSKALLKHQVLQNQIKEARGIIEWIREATTPPSALDAVEAAEVKHLMRERCSEWLKKCGE